MADSEKSLAVGATKDMAKKLEQRIELKQFAASLDHHLERIPMLNDSAAFVNTLASVLIAHKSFLCPTS